jgi:hypothetical protein
MCRLADPPSITDALLRNFDRWLSTSRTFLLTPRTGLIYGSAASRKTMSSASMADLIGGISTTCGLIRPVRVSGWPFMPFTWSVRWQTGRYLCLRTTDLLRSRPPASVSSGLGWPQAGFGGVVFSKLSKLLDQENALSAPCLQHFRNYCGAIKVARCGFP